MYIPILIPCKVDGRTRCCVFATFVVSRFAGFARHCLLVLDSGWLWGNYHNSRSMCNDAQRMNVLAGYKKIPLYSWT